MTLSKRKVSNSSVNSPRFSDKRPIRGWSKEDARFVIEHAQALTIKEIADALGRSYSATHAYMKKHNLVAPRRSTSDADRDYIKLHWGQQSVEEISKNIQLSPATVYREVKNLGLTLSHPKRNWTKEEEAYLIEHWGSKSVSEICQCLQREAGCVRQKAYHFGLRKDPNKKRRIWTEAEVAYLCQHWGREPVHALSHSLQRTASAIRIKAGLLGLERLRDPQTLTPWDKEDERYLIDHWQSESAEQLAKVLNKSLPSIYTKAHRLGLGRKIDDGYSASEVARILNVPHVATVIGWIEKGWITERRSLFKKNNYCITETQLKKFMRQHPDVWNFETLTYDPFHDSKDPWVSVKRQADHEKQRQKTGISLTS